MTGRELAMTGRELAMTGGYLVISYFISFGAATVPAEPVPFAWLHIVW